MKEKIKYLSGTPFIALITNVFTLMVVYSVSRLFFFAFNQDLFSDITKADLLRMCLGGMRFDLTAILYLNILYLVLTVVPFRFRSSNYYRIIEKCIYLITNIFGILANCYDMIYFRFINRRTTLSFFKEFQNEGNLINIAIQGAIEYWYVTLLAIVLITLLIVSFREVKYSDKPENNWTYYIFHTLILCVTVFLTIGGIRSGYSATSRPISCQIANQYVNKPQESNIVLNTTFTLIMSVESDNFTIPNYFSDRDELTSLCNPYHNPAPIKQFKSDNVVIIIVEGLAREYMQFYYKELDNGTFSGYTPFLDSLAAQGLTFKHSFATGKTSIEALPSILCGIPSLIKPFVDTPYINDNLFSIAHCLEKKGYYTSFFHGAPNGSMGLQAFTNIAGISHYYGMNEYGNMKDFDGTWAIWDNEFLQYFANTLSTINKPFLGVVFTATSHHPFKIDPKFDGKFKKGPEPMYECIGYTDYALKEFFKTASKCDWYKNTLFVITADHTNVITRGDFMNGRGYFDVPIIFYHPGDSSLTGYSDRIVGHTDIYPSILGYLNYDEQYFSFGKDIFDKNDSSNHVINYWNMNYQLFQDSLLIQYDGEQTTSAFNYRTDISLQHNISDVLLQKTELENLIKANIQTYIECLVKDSLTIK